ncbi:unnamed protein product [Pipistrellus nathusii]|uniref:Orange domain-containing protein n=1 Tax=Pipistrellus nathusii TaxID=59473 RepID=A0ABN9ZQL0_PIPNA
MPADTPGRPGTSPRAAALASASRTPSRLRAAAAHRKVGPGRAWAGGAGGDGGTRDSATAHGPPAALQAGHGEAAPSANQREPRPAQGPAPGRAQEGERPPLEAGEGGHPGADVRRLRSLRRGPAAGEPRWETEGRCAGPPGEPPPVPLPPAAPRAAAAALSRYRAGFSEGLAEVHRFLAACEDIPADVRSRLLGHLAACLGHMGPPSRSARPAPATEGPTPEVSVGHPPLPGFDGPFAPLRPEPALAPPLLPGLTRAPRAAPSAGLQGRSAP